MPGMGPQVVVGASGFTGARVVAALLERSETVRTAELGPGLAPALAGAETVHQAVDLRPALGRHPLTGEPHPGLVALVAAAGAAGVRRVVHLSSATVAGMSGEVGEQSPARPLHAGDRLRLRDEEWLLEQPGPEVVILRPAQPFGNGEPLLEALLEELSGGRLRLPAGGGAPRTFLSGPDLGRAFAAAAERGRPGRAYLLGGFQGSWRELVTAAAGASRRPAALGASPRGLALARAAFHLLRMAPGVQAWPTPAAVDLVALPQHVDDGPSRRELSWSPVVGSFEEGFD